MTSFCAREAYSGPVLGAVIYTDKPFQQAALPLEMKSISGSFRLSGQFKEIVLSEYTQAELTGIDPRLIVLAPFTVPGTMKKEKLAAACQQWKHTIERVYEEDKHNECVEILGLFILNRFRNLSLKEVIAMLNFDLQKTKAGQELIGIGIEKGILEGIEKGILEGIEKGVKKGKKEGKKEGEKKGSLLKAREMLIFAIEEKFNHVPESVRVVIRGISKEKHLNELFRKVLRCQTLDEFMESLREVQPS
jgi:predicted transposase YdaD